MLLTPIEILKGSDEIDAMGLLLGDEFCYGDNDQTYSELWQRYINSAEGGIHQAAQPPRFAERYGYDPCLMRDDLGHDVDPVEHMDDVHDILVRVLAVELGTRHHLGQLAVSDIPLCRFTAQVHDVGENTHLRYGGGVGDIAYGDKTPEQRAIEQDVRIQIFRRYWPDLPVHLLHRADNLIMHKPQETEDIAAYEALEAAHTIGSFTTGIVSGKAGISILRELETQGKEQASLPELERRRLTQLIRLGREVTASMQPRMEEISNRFVYGGMLLTLLEPDFQRIQRDLTV